MHLQQLLDRVYITRARAIALGFNHEGTHFGVPVWCQYDEDIDEMGIVAAKFGPLEIVMEMGASVIQAANAFREPGDEYLFLFRIRPIQP